MARRWRCTSARRASRCSHVVTIHSKNGSLSAVVVDQPRDLSGSSVLPNQRRDECCHISSERTCKCRRGGGRPALESALGVCAQGMATVLRTVLGVSWCACALLASMANAVKGACVCLMHKLPRGMLGSGATAPGHAAGAFQCAPCAAQFTVLRTKRKLLRGLGLCLLLCAALQRCRALQVAVPAEHFIAAHAF